MFNYQIYGPYKIPKTRSVKGKALDMSAQALNGFWDGVDKNRENLRNARGCYVFAHRAGGGFKPWYVGQSKGPFHNEVFTHKNQNHYNQVYHNLGAATPVIFLVARCTPRGKLSGKTLSQAEADFVEQKLIGHALSKNKKLINVSNTKLHKKVVIPGVHNSSGKLEQAATDLRTALGIKAPKSARPAKKTTAEKK